MSASTEDLLEQITILELKLEEAKLSSRPLDKIILNLESELTELREKFHSMNESLKDQKNILKG